MNDIVLDTPLASLKLSDSGDGPTEEYIKSKRRQETDRFTSTQGLLIQVEIPRDLEPSEKFINEPTGI